MDARCGSRWCGRCTCLRTTFYFICAITCLNGWAQGRHRRPKFKVEEYCPRRKSQSRLYPFGTCVGDVAMAPTDDGFERMKLPTDITVFGSSVQEIFVNNNGVISFESGVQSFKPNTFPQSRRVIAPYWSDIDTRLDTGKVFYRVEKPQLKVNKCLKQPSSTDSLLRAQRAVEDALPGILNFRATIVVIVTWHEVTSHRMLTEKKAKKRNTFQLVLVSDGFRTYSFFIYDKLQWGTSVQVSAKSNGYLEAVMIGFDNGDKKNWYMVPSMNMTEVSNLYSPMGTFKGYWFSQFNLVGKLAPLMRCQQLGSCCLATGQVYVAKDACRSFEVADYLNSGNPGKHHCPQGLTFNTSPLVCTCDYPSNTQCMLT